MNDSIKVIAEFIDNASGGVKAAGDVVKEFYAGLAEGAKAELEAQKAAKDYGDAQETAGSQVAAFTKTLAVMATALFSTKQILDGFIASATQADKFDDLSEKVGISASSLRGLGYAAQLSGSSVDGLVSAIDKLSRNAVGSEEDMKKQSQAFRDLGVEIKDAAGNIKDSETLFLDLADAFAGIEDGPEKSAAAFRVFGSEAKNLLPLLNRGSAGIKELREEAEQLGRQSPAEFNAMAAASATLFDNIDRLGLVFTGLFNELNSNLIPVFNVMIDQVIESAKEGGLLNDIFTGIAATFRNLVVPAVKVGAVIFDALTSTIKIAGRGVGALAAALVALGSGNLTQARNIIKDYGNDVDTVVQQHADFTRALNNAGSAAQGLAGKVEQPRRRITALGKDAKDAKSELQGMLDALSIANNSFGQDESQKQLLDAELKYAKDVLTIGKAKADQLFAQVKVQIELNKQLREEADIQAKVLAANNTLDTEAQSLAIQEAMVEAAGKTADERERIVQAVRDQYTLSKLIDGLSESEAANVEARFLSLVKTRDELKAAARDAAITNDIVDKSREAITSDVTRHIQAAAKLLESGKITVDDYNTYQLAQLERLKDKTKETTSEMQVFWKAAGEGIQSDLKTTIFDFMQGKLTNLGDAVKKTIDGIVAQMLAAKLATALFGSDIGKGNLGGIVGQGVNFLGSLFGARAAGGDVIAGKAYMVGERGPEPFIPRVNGTVLPNSVLSQQPNVTVQVTAIDSRDFMSKMSEVKREVAEMVSNTNRSYRLKGA